MRTEPFKETHDVELTEEDRRLRAGQASRAWPALRRQEDAIEAKKEEQKATIKQMEADKKTIINTAQAAARAAETGFEPRLVDCQESIVGVMVVTRRLDTGETVHDRMATKPELEEWDRLHPVKVPGGGAKKTTPEPPAPGDGHDASGIAGALDAALARICATPRAEGAVLAALRKDVSSSSPIDRKAAIKRALDAGHLGELPEGHKDAGKLLWAPTEPDEGIVPDDYTGQPDPVH